MWIREKPAQFPPNLPQDFLNKRRNIHRRVLWVRREKRMPMSNLCVPTTQSWCAVAGKFRKGLVQMRWEWNFPVFSQVQLFTLLQKNRQERHRKTKEQRQLGDNGSLPSTPSIRNNRKGGTASLRSRTCVRRNAVFGARSKGLSLYFSYQKEHLTRIKTGVDTYLIRIQTRI